MSKDLGKWKTKEGHVREANSRADVVAFKQRGYKLVEEKKSDSKSADKK